jgi:hypothetical protein
MISRDEARRLLQLALDEFAPQWEIWTGPIEVTIRDPHHWLSGIGTFGVTLRDRATGAMKVLGRRSGVEEGAMTAAAIRSAAICWRSASPTRRSCHAPSPWACREPSPHSDPDSASGATPHP